MPLVDGIDTYLTLKDMGYDINTILMTAYTTGERVKQYMNKGIYGIIFKPVDVNIILEMIEEICRSDKHCLPDNENITREGNMVNFSGNGHEGDTIERKREHLDCR
jgi:DNA-binding NtrC family response regulator